MIMLINDIKIKKGVMFLFLTSIYNMLFSVNFALRVKVFFFRHCYVTNVMLTFYPSSSGFCINGNYIIAWWALLDHLVLCVCFVDRCLSFCTIVLSVLLQYTVSDYSDDIFKLFLQVQLLITVYLTSIGVYINKVQT
jgi:hypothetical protein